MDYNNLGYELADHVAVLTCDRPEQRNAISRDTVPGVCGYSRRFDVFNAEEALRIGLANEVVPEGRALERALELAHEIAALPQGAIRTDKETMMRNVGRPLEEQIRQEAEACLAMFQRRDPHAIGASAFKAGTTPEWPNHGL